MTKEEALSKVKGYLTDLLPSEEYGEVEEIIEALKQEPCEDAISREAVLKEIPRLWNSGGDKDYCMETLRDFVAELPPVNHQNDVKNADGFKDYSQYEYLFDQVDKMPMATPTRRKVKNESSSENPNKWIPCSERLPEDRDWYLGIFKEPDTGWINPLPFICDYMCSKTKATTKEHWILRGFTDRDECIDYYFNLECVAWHPLPKPYKAEKGE